MDILALRQLDQRIEQEWVANITTISIRARYLSLLPWLFSEFYSIHLNTEGGRAAFDEEEFRQAAARLELIVLASSKLGKRWGESGITFGSLGSVLYYEELNHLMQSGNLDLELGTKGGQILSTYAMPCRGFGLLTTTAGNAAAPVRVEPRGLKLHQARSKALLPDGLTRLIFDGGNLTIEALEAEGRFFSLGSRGVRAGHCPLKMYNPWQLL